MTRPNRIKPIMVRTSPEEHALFTKLAESRHTTVSELIRQLLHREIEARLTQTPKTQP